MNIERWKPVVGWEGHYEVSDLGRVRSIRTADSLGRRRTPRVLAGGRTAGYPSIVMQFGDRVETKLVHRTVLEAFVGPAPDGMECCHNDGDPSNPRLSNLRWDTHSENMRDRRGHGTDHNANRDSCKRGHPFVGENMVANVLARGRRQCHACRLEATRSKRAGEPFNENLADAAFAKLKAGRDLTRGEALTQSKITESIVIEIRERVAAGSAFLELASEYGITPSAIGAVARGDNWAHVGGPLTRRPRTKRTATIRRVLEGKNQ